MTITILDPRAEPGIPVEPYKLRGDTGKPGLKIGLLSNGFPDATTLLLAVGRALEAKLSGPNIQLFERTSPSIVADEAMLKDTTQFADIVVTAIGHCGSCTSSAVRDAVNVARLGRPAAALISEKFLPTAQYVARSVGMPDIPIVRLPYPVSGTGIANITRIGDSITDALLAAWRAENTPAPGRQT